MPRQKRITKMDELHLVVAKANGGVLLYYEEEDYHAYLQQLRQIVRDRFLQVYAFCLQQFEVRLIVKPRRMPLSQIIQRLHGSHTLRVNHRMGRNGALFQGRYRSVLFPREDLANAVRSVHLWPVRNGTVKRTENYKWSSHGAYLSSSDQFSDIVSCGEVLNMFGEGSPSAERSFARFVESAALDSDSYSVCELIDDTSSNYSEENSLGRMRKASVEYLTERACLFLNINKNQLLSDSRRQELVMARRLIATTAVMQVKRSATEVAKFLQRDKAQISRLISQGLDLLDNDEPFKTLYESMKSRSVKLPKWHSLQSERVE